MNEFCCSKHYWGIYEQNSIVNRVRVDDWTDEWTIIASNVLSHFSWCPPFVCFYFQYNVDNYNKCVVYHFITRHMLSTLNVSEINPRPLSLFTTCVKCCKNSKMVTLGRECSHLGKRHWARTCAWGFCIPTPCKFKQILLHIVGSVPTTSLYPQHWTCIHRMTKYHL